MDLAGSNALEQDVFSVHVPNAFEIIEKSDSQDAGEVALRRIGGFCSTEDLDRQGEIVVAKGLDFSEFVKFDWFNDNHRQDTDAGLGYPTDARLEKGRWWTEGYLIAGYPPSDRIWEMAKALQKTGGTRRLGFSIEGKVIERDGRNKILRAKIRDVAITRVPVNTSCSWTILAKSFAEPAAVEEAAQKALAASHQSPRMSDSAVLRPEELEAREGVEHGLSIEQVIKMVRDRWPHLSDRAVHRAARYAVNFRIKEE